MQKIYKGAVEISHDFVKKIVKPGDKVVDATVGNGKDTVFLAKLVGPEGKVFGFDVQQEAIITAKERLREEGLDNRVIFFHEGHEVMDREVPPGISAVMFNLGYLPGGNHDIITSPKTTIPALKKSLKLLVEGGIVSIVVYTGHSGGREEGQEIEEWAGSLPSSHYEVLKICYLNKKKYPPYFIYIQKLLRDDK